MATEKKIMMNSYKACSIVEGFDDGENATEEEQQEAWAYLIKTGLCWSLQGSYGRAAQRMIEDGIFSPSGEILKPVN